jgi:hypothetical protein
MMTLNTFERNFTDDDDSPEDRSTETQDSFARMVEAQWESELGSSKW